MPQNYRSPYRLTFFKPLLIVLAGFLLFGVSGCSTTERIGSNLKPNPEKRIGVGVNAAKEYLKVGDTENALRHIEVVLDLDKRHAPAHQILALIYLKEGQTERAEISFKKAIDLDPTLSTARNNYSSFLFNQNRYPEAAEQLEVAVQDISYDNRARALENLGVIYQEMGEDKKAEDAFIRGLRINKNLGRSRLELAGIALKRKNYQQASQYIKDYARVAKHTPRSLWLGIQIEKLNGDRNALGSYELSLRNLYPKSKEYQLYLEAKSR